MTPRPDLKEAELRQHIADCGLHLESAYARFQAYDVPADREAAVMWLHQQQEAQRALQRHLDGGLDYFAAAGARDRAVVAGRAV